MDSENRLEVFQRQAEFCKSLADAKRLMIIRELREGERSVNELAEKLGLKQSNTSQHLSILRRAGVVSTRREGSTVYYELANHRIGEACDLVQGFIAEQVKVSQLLAGSL